VGIRVDYFRKAMATLRYRFARKAIPESCVHASCGGVHSPVDWLVPNATSRRRFAHKEPFAKYFEDDPFVMDRS
jgi:hypothetical protein